MRYLRQTILPEIGQEGQTCFARARVLVIGAGGLANAALPYLVGAGIGQAAMGGCITVVDGDSVSLNNLHRQTIYRPEDIGKNKASVLCQRLESLNTTVQCIAHPEFFCASNADAWVQNHDMILDASDNFSCKLLIHQSACAHQKPWVYASVTGWEGQMSVFDSRVGTSCYQCLYPETQELENTLGCSVQGVIGPLVAVIASMQAVEICKLALGAERLAKHHLELMTDQLCIVDGRDWTWRKLKMNTQAHHNHSQTHESTPTTADEYTWAQFLALSTHSSSPFLVIDVRSHAERAQRHWSKASHIPIEQLADELRTGRFLPPPSTTIFVHCEQGLRSRKACALLRANGWKATVLHIDWGNLTENEVA